MKKILLTLALLVTMGFNTTAQAFSFDWGITGGYNLTKLKLKGGTNQLYESDNRSGWFIGAKANIGLAMGFGLDGALIYSQNKLNMKDDYADQDVSRNRTNRTMEIPLNLKYSIGLGSVANIYATTGPQFDFNLNDNNWNITSESYTGTFNREKMSTSWNVGAGVKLLSHLDLGIVYNFGISKMGKTVINNLGGDTSWIKNDHVRMNTFKVQMTYYF